VSFIALFLFTSLCAAGQRTPERIVTLSPALAQTVIDLGLENKLVCSAGPLDAVRTKKKLGTIGLYHKPNLELIIGCKPDFILTTYAGTPENIHKKLKELKYEIMFDKPENLDSIKKLIIALSKRFNINNTSILKEFDTVCVSKLKASGIMVIGFNPLIAIGKRSFVSSALKCAGFENIMDGNYPKINIEYIIKQKPQKILVAMVDPSGFKDYKTLKMIFGDKVVLVDPNSILLPSTRIINGIKEIKKILK